VQSVRSYNSLWKECVFVASYTVACYCCCCCRRCSFLFVCVVCLLVRSIGRSVVVVVPVWHVPGQLYKMLLVYYLFLAWWVCLLYVFGQGVEFGCQMFYLYFFCWFLSVIVLHLSIVCWMCFWYESGHHIRRKYCDKCVCVCVCAQWRTERGVWGVNPPPPPHEIPKFWQSWAEFPVLWKIHPNNLIRIRVLLICKLSGTPD
jgi:hypothetical protein